MQFNKYFKNIHEQYGVINYFSLVVFTVLLVVIIDYFNLFTLIYNKLGLPVVICILSFAFIKLFSLNFQSLLKLKSVNYIDFYSTVIFISVVIYKIYLDVFKNIFVIYPYKDIISKIILLICGLLILYRYIYITITVAKNNKNKSKNVNIFNLKQLCDNDVSKDVQFILIEDDAADYDLLERDRIINQITNTIINCNIDEKFVMSLKGDWGSGKTTILNNVKKRLKKENIIFIDNFEPWVYENESVLLSAFFDIIMKNINCGFRINEINKFTKVYLKTIANNAGFSLNDIFENNMNINRVKRIINNYLEANDKKIVLVLDNLERCSSEHILFILKMIHNLFDFKRILYILSYDEKSMKKHFEKKLDIDYSYLEKIIQLEFSVPKLDKNVLQNIINKCIVNYIEHSKVNIDENEIQKLVKIISNEIKNLRDLKRIINSTFNSSFNNMDYLNSLDMLLIEVIAFKNIELWNEVNKNGIYYISEDINVYDDKYIFSIEKYNIDATKYFNELFKNNKFNVKSYKEILCYLFPNVKKYFEENRYNKKEKIKFIYEHPIVINQKEYRASVLNKRIYNGKYFNLYFSKNENEFIKMNKKINDFIEYINNINFEFNDLYKEYFEMEKVYQGWREKETLNIFRMNLDKIVEEKRLDLLRVLYLSYYIVDDSILLFQHSAKIVTGIITSDLIEMLNATDFDNFIKKIEKDYCNLYFINEILYWLNPEKSHNELVNSSRYKTIKNIYDEMIQKIKKNKINMYSFENYNRYNMILLFDDDNYMIYIKEEINEESLMLFILDCISTSLGSDGIGYKFNTKNIEKFYGWEKAKKDIEKCPESELKNFLLNAIYNLIPFENEDEKNTYYVEKPVDINQLINEYKLQHGNIINYEN